MVEKEALPTGANAGPARVCVVPARTRTDHTCCIHHVTSLMVTSHDVGHDVSHSPQMDLTACYHVPQNPITGNGSGTHDRDLSITEALQVIP